MAVGPDAEKIAEKAVEILARLVEFDTTSSESNLDMIDFVSSYLAVHDVGSRKILSADASKANLLATIGSPGGSGIVLSGHTDVVPVAGQPWTHAPFRLTRDGDRLFGRGTADMKSFLALVLAAVPHLARVPLARPVHLALSYDEEVGCLGAPHLIRALLEEGHRPLAVIVGEPTGMGIVNSHKGLDLYEVVVTGREAHSSLAHEGVSANMVSIDLLHALAEIARRERAEHHDPRFNPSWSTLTVGTLRGGTASNILARECRFTFDLRHIPGRDADIVLAPFWEKLEETRADLARDGDEASIVVHRLARVPALRQEEDGAAEALAAQLSGSNAPATAVSYGAEAGQYQMAGMSTVICGPGSIDQAHRPDEYIEMSQMTAGARFITRLIAFAQTG